MRTLRVTLAASLATRPPVSAARTRKLQRRALVQESLDRRAAGRLVSRSAMMGGGGATVSATGVVAAGAGGAGRTKVEPLSVAV